MFSRMQIRETIMRPWSVLALAETAPRLAHRPWLYLSILALVPLAAYPQTTLTGSMLFSTTSNGAWNNYAELNTVGGDNWWDLWLALNPDATSPVNGPSDAEAGISIPLQAGKSYKYYFFGSGPCCTSSETFTALNLFFNGNGSTPGISVFGALNTYSFVPDGNTTITLAGDPVAGSGTSFYNSGGLVVVLSGYDANASATPPGDVCQPFEFSPGDAPSFFGSFSLQVFPAAALSLSQTGGPPGTKVTTTGSGFAAAETVGIYIDDIGGPPLMTTTTDASGAFTVIAREPQAAYGPAAVYAVGLTSGKLGAASFFVTPALVMTPRAGVPGETTKAQALGFGAGETVDIYWGEPRQLLGATTANGQGTSTLTIAIPADAPRGPNGVLGVGQTTQATGIGAILVK